MVFRWLSSEGFFGGENRFAAGGSGERALRLIDRLLGRTRGLGGGGLPSKADERAVVASPSREVGVVGFSRVLVLGSGVAEASLWLPVAPAELGLTVAFLRCVGVQSEVSFECASRPATVPSRRRGKAEFGGVEGLEEGGDGGSGVGGVCHDCTE